MSLSDVLSGVSSKYTPGLRTSWETTTRSVPLITNVPWGVMSGKSPMKTVWLLISPVSLFTNSAVTNSGAEYVTSRSLHSSTVYLGSSKRWSRKLSDIVSERSSIGEISSKISSRPDFVFTSVRPCSSASATDWRHTSLPTSQSKESICRSRRLGTSMGSWIFANEIRPLGEMTLVFFDAARETAKTMVLPRNPAGRFFACKTPRVKSSRVVK